MGQKVSPISMRLQVTKDWASKWFAPGKKEYAKTLANDLKLRAAIEKKFETRAVINNIDIERSANSTTVTVWTSKAGIVIGRGGEGVQALRAELEKIAGEPIRLNIEEIRKPDLAAKIVAENIARQLEHRINFRRAMKMALQNVMAAGAKGIRIEVAGRLNGAEMSRREKMIDGSVPLHTLRANIDYHLAVAKTPAGTIGIKVWINKGERR
ncbi:30S ribosomal protein S3 [Candidatus Saccharibacteria bacterium]|nr:30S ribosomal protein S3 [Candidatus Saccharibacteria bacterium]MCL1962682.1 30S ribosomal protein S3 [Candidatus Saccharibacteria bacterium]